MLHLGATELVIILVIVILLFGVGRIGKIAGELNSGIKAFRVELGTTIIRIGVLLNFLIL
jgi:TatA/E family protein of Tat protein translocase